MVNTHKSFALHLLFHGQLPAYLPHRGLVVGVHHSLQVDFQKGLAVLLVPLPDFRESLLDELSSTNKNKQTG